MGHTLGDNVNVDGVTVGDAEVEAKKTGPAVGANAGPTVSNGSIGSPGVGSGAGAPVTLMDGDTLGDRVGPAVSVTLGIALGAMVLVDEGDISATDGSTGEVDSNEWGAKVVGRWVAGLAVCVSVAVGGLLKDGRRVILPVGPKIGAKDGD